MLLLFFPAIFHRRNFRGSRASKRLTIALQSIVIQSLLVLPRWFSKHRVTFGMQHRPEYPYSLFCLLVDLQGDYRRPLVIARGFACFGPMLFRDNPTMDVRLTSRRAIDFRHLETGTRGSRDIWQNCCSRQE